MLYIAFSFTNEGIDNLTSEVQLLNAPFSMFVTEEGIVTSFNDLQSLNAHFSITETDEGISM